MQIGYYNTPVLIGLIIGLFFILKWVIEKPLAHIIKGKLIQPSILALIGIILLLINNYMWNLPLINPLLINVPIIEGEYEGFVQIEHINNTKPLENSEIKVKIKQTGTSTYFDLYSSKGSHSIGLVTEFVYLNGNWKMFQIYENKNLDNPMNVNHYLGMAQFEIPDNYPKEIKGRFSTDFTRKTFGTVFLKRNNE